MTVSYLLQVETESVATVAALFLLVVYTVE
jgi:hypothetical protein